MTVIRALHEHLHVFEQRSGRAARVITELLIDTGRRPDEICALPMHCLDQDAHGKYVLVYTDSKNYRLGRRLPISDETARRIREQQAWTQQQYPMTPADDLPLFPRDYSNRTGTRPASQQSYTDAHRKFVDTIATELADLDGAAFPASKVTPYCYRHSFAQRHADNGTPPDVLRELMDHTSLTTTMGYYRVSEHRVRGAVEEVARHQFDGQGRPILGAVSGLLADEHARLRVGQVAVPFGTCTEPSNVKAGGHACPFKFTCLGCGHFRSDPSYLPELKSYLQQLLADREQIMAATELQDWARQKVLPAQQEIDQLRGLIGRIEQDLGTLSDEDQQTIQHAVDVVRAARQTVDLGMPNIPPPLGPSGAPGE